MNRNAPVTAASHLKGLLAEEPGRDGAHPSGQVSTHCPAGRMGKASNRLIAVFLHETLGGWLGGLSGCCQLWVTAANYPSQSHFFGRQRLARTEGCAGYPSADRCLAPQLAAPFVVQLDQAGLPARSGHPPIPWEALCQAPLLLQQAPGF